MLLRQLACIDGEVDIEAAWCTRYLAHDGLAGEEGTFLLCTFWLAQAQALAGEVDAAMATFERAVAAVNDVGLLAEEVDADRQQRRRAALKPPGLAAAQRLLLMPAAGAVAI